MRRGSGVADGDPVAEATDLFELKGAMATHGPPLARAIHHLPSIRGGGPTAVIMGLLLCWFCKQRREIGIAPPHITLGVVGQHLESL